MTEQTLPIQNEAEGFRLDALESVKRMTRDIQSKDKSFDLPALLKEKGIFYLQNSALDALSLDSLNEIADTMRALVPVNPAPDTPPLRRPEHKVNGEVPKKEEPPKAEKQEPEKEAINPDEVLPGWEGFTARQVNILKVSCFPTLVRTQDMMVVARLAQKYDLDPFAKEIWAWDTNMPKEFKGKAEDLHWTPKIVIEASAAGWRKIIMRDESGVKNLVANPVFKDDIFDADMVTGEVKHEVKGFPPEKENPLGAYCQVEFKDGKKVVKVVRWDEYEKTTSPYDNPWKRQKSAMICQKAYSRMGRERFGISGIYSEGEVLPDPNPMEKLPGAPGYIPGGAFDRKEQLRSRKKNRKHRH